MKRTTLLMLAAVLMGGCRADILKRDQLEIRQALLDMYQDEVMDNLIRTKLMLPVIQVDYRTMTGTMTSLTKGIGGYSKEADRNQLGVVGSTTPVHVTKTFPSISGEQDESTQLTLTGEPVCDDKLYVAYQEYLYGPSAKAAPPGPHEQPTTMPTTAPVTSEEKSAGSQLAIGQQPTNSVYTVVLTTPVRAMEAIEPVPQGELLCSGDKPPAEGTYHVMKEFRGKYWYVPTGSAKAFFALYRRVVLTRRAAPTTGENLGNELQLFRLNQLQ